MKLNGPICRALTYAELLTYRFNLPGRYNLNVINLQIMLQETEIKYANTDKSYHYIVSQDNLSVNIN